jgi:hypothetical protein
MKGIQVWSNKEPVSRQTGDSHKYAKTGLAHSKILFSRTTGPEKLRFT